MTNEKKSEFYLVREEILPEAIKKPLWSRKSSNAVNLRLSMKLLQRLG